MTSVCSLEIFESNYSVVSIERTVRLMFQSYYFQIVQYV